MRLLQVADAPDHVEDGRRDEQQARDHSAQDRLRIPEDGRERRGAPPAASPPVAPPASRFGSSRKSGTLIASPTTPMPTQKLRPRQARGDQRADQELAGRSAGHAEHLGGADQGRGARRGEVLGGDVDGADQREDAARALQEASQRSPRPCCPRRTAARRRRRSPRRSGITRRGPSRSIATPATRLNGE